jgi:hypothetical protein
MMAGGVFVAVGSVGGMGYSLSFQLISVFGSRFIAERPSGLLPAGRPPPGLLFWWLPATGVNVVACVGIHGCRVVLIGSSFTVVSFS